MPQDTRTPEAKAPDFELPTAPNPAPASTPEEEPAILEELIIEEVDIDGMCGVY